MTTLDRLVLVHVSDPHCASRTENSFGDKRHEEGHDDLLVGAMHNAMRLAAARHGLESPEDLLVAMTGDLTHLGTEAQFRVGHQIFSASSWCDKPTGDKPTPPASRPPVAFMIPGNHDHWDGGPRVLVDVAAYNNKIFKTGSAGEPTERFDRTPWRAIIQSPGRTFRLHLYGVDSNSGKSRLKYNLHASGEIADAEFAGLSRLLKEEKTEAMGEQAPVVRVLLCHHSLSHEIRYPWTGPLDRVSKDRIVALSALYGLDAALTGHTHVFQENRYRNVADGVFWERRSATAIKGKPQVAKQGYFVHVLTHDPERNQVGWLAERYLWDGSAFALVDQAHHRDISRAAGFRTPGRVAKNPKNPREGSFDM